jgi:hypothetical protein
MKVSYVNLQALFREKVADSAQLKHTVSIALGLALGRNAPMPASMPELARSYYAENIQANIDRAAAEFNENIVIDFDLVGQLARSTWLIRAGLCHPTAMVDACEAATPGDIFTQMSNESHTLSGEVYAFMNSNREVLFVMMNRIIHVMTGPEEERRGGALVSRS